MEHRALNAWLTSKIVSPGTTLQPHFVPRSIALALIALARDLPTTWNARGTDARTKQRITHILIGR
jgi:hypothetical protein